ncbi:TIGR04372 family glycosyltransferase [Desulfovibrio sp.]
MKKNAQPRYRIKLRWFRPLFWPVLLPVVIAIWLYNKLSPIPIRIYLMRVDRIGHLAENTELVCCKIDLGIIKKEIRIFVHRDIPCNMFLFRMWSRVLYVNQLFLLIYDVCKKLGGLGILSDEMQTPGLNSNNMVEKCPRHLSFTPDELRDAERQCRELGHDGSRPHVCVLGRDAVYLQQHNPHEDNSHYEFRNVDINTYIPALEHLAERFTVIRMGSVARDRLQTTNPRIIDYPFSGKRTELLDIYLSGTCRFFISTGTGLDSVASICFRVPMLFVNFIPVALMVNWGSANLSIFKHYWLVEEKRFLTLSEILDSGVGDSYDAYRIRKFGVEIVDNSPEELLDAVREMEARLDGAWEEDPEDARLQQAYWDICRQRYPRREYVARIGAKFLRNNPNWAR